MLQLLNVVVLVFYFLLPLESSAQISDKDYILPVGANELKVMSYNVENLFDSVHDRGKKDYEFLPKDHPQKSNCPKRGAYSKSCVETDWTDERVQLKLEQLKRVIAAQGPRPDVLVLVEVENPRVVRAAVEVLGYSGFVMTESPDDRGIDCAVLYSKNKLKLRDFQERVVENAMFPTRNLSVALFDLAPELGGGVLGIFPNHWPSPASPTKSRLIVAEELKSFVDDISETFGKKDFHYLLAGDFNTIEGESPHPIDSILLSTRWKARLADVHDLAESTRHPLMRLMPRATYYYANEDAWNKLDRFFISRSLYDGQGFDVDVHSYRIHAPGFLTRKNEDGDKIPFRYNHNASSKRTLGYSDHFGIVVKFQYQ